jgi:beta-lactamase regulating signal transducer with metallopeptidase domain
MMLIPDLVELWGAAFWRASLQGGLAVLAVWTVCRLAPSIPARFRCWLWRLAMLKFLVALAWAAPIELPLLPDETPVASSGNQFAADAAIPPMMAAAETAQAPAASLSQGAILFVAWIAIVGWGLARLAVAYRHAILLRARSVRSEDQPLLAELARLSRSAGLSQPPELRVVEGTGSPLIVGIWRPVLVLPKATLSSLDAAERTLVLGHELAHAARRDLAWSALAAACRILFWFHPLVWLSERRLALAQEIAADEFAMTLQRQPADRYAATLVSIVEKLGSAPGIPAWSAGTAGPHQSLQQRLFAMRYVKPVSAPLGILYAAALGVAVLLGGLPWRIVAAETPAASQPAPSTKSGSARGRFVSFVDGTLTIEANDGSLFANQVPASAKGLKWGAGKYEPADPIAFLKGAAAGTYCRIIVDKDTVTVYLDARKDQTIGTVVAFKDGRLLMLGKSLGVSYVKKYGNQVHFNRFRDDTPAYESVDGGAYQRIGTANKVLSTAREGAFVTVHGEGDDNITAIYIGVPKDHSPTRPATGTPR